MLFQALLFIVVAIVVVALFARPAKRRKKEAQYYPENKQLYVGNLSYHASNVEIKQFFDQYGAVDNVRMIRNPRTGRAKGFAFVTYLNIKDAKKALAANGKIFKHRTLVVRMAKPREE